MTAYNRPNSELDPESVELTKGMNQICQRIQAVLSKHDTARVQSVNAADVTKNSSVNETSARREPAVAQQEFVGSRRTAASTPPATSVQPMDDWIYSSVAASSAMHSKSVEQSAGSLKAKKSNDDSLIADSTSNVDRANTPPSTWTGWLREEEQPDRDWGDLV